MINENTTFREYLDESGYTEEQYISEVYAALDKIYSNYRLNYYQYNDQIKQAFTEDIPVNKIAAHIASLIDTEWSDDDSIKNNTHEEEIETLDDTYEDEVKPFGYNWSEEQWEEYCDNYKDDEYDQENKEYQNNIVEDDIDENTNLYDLPKIKFTIRITPKKGNVIYKFATAPSHISSINILKNMMENRLNMELVEDIKVYPSHNEKLDDSKLVDESKETKETKKEEKPDDGISDGETYKDWKMNVFKYIDKRVDINKVKELGTYIKDFIKHEYDNGEPAWFGVAESIVNYARINYPNCVKTYMPYNLDENIFSSQKFDKNPYINKVLSILSKKGIDVNTYKNKIVEFILDFKNDGYDVWDTSDCAFQHFHKLRIN